MDVSIDLIVITSRFVSASYMEISTHLQVGIILPCHVHGNLHGFTSGMVK